MPKTRTSKKAGKKKQRKETNTSSTSEKVPTIIEEEKRVSVESSLPEISENDMQRGRYLVNELRALFEKAVSSSRKQYERYSQNIEKYFRFKFKFYGFKAAERRSTQSQWLEMYGEELTNRGVLMSCLCSLWEEEMREMQSCGCDIAHKYRHVLLGTEEEDFKMGVACVQHLITCKSWWDSVDALSYPGHMVEKRPQWGVPLMNQWITNENLWLRRVAILHQLNLKTATDHQRLFQFCLSRAHEDEFFILKAIGWALRQYARTDPVAVKKFVEDHRTELSNLSIKEALKHIH